MGKVIILRGIPGSGKSTYIKNNLKDPYVASADHYFMKDGRYEFDIKQIGKAHGACRKAFSDALTVEAPLIVVDNTNIKVRDFKNYIADAKTCGYDVEIVRLECDPAVAARRNVHNVPKDVIERMHKELLASKLPDGLTELVVNTSPCTCGSGAHPRLCKLHPEAFEEHIADIDRAMGEDDN